MHVHIFDEEQKSVLELLAALEIVEDFYLAGGTALALQYGHRQSVDFDFFKEEPFAVDKVIQAIGEKTKPDIRVNEENTLLLLIDGISCSFFKYPYPLIQKTIDFENHIRLASIADTAAMKVSAISTRGTKRDFVDLYFICKRDYSLMEVLAFFKQKFSQLNHELYHVYKSLMYFGDAEEDDMPVMYEETDWDEIKSYFIKEVTKLME